MLDLGTRHITDPDIQKRKIEDGTVNFARISSRQPISLLLAQRRSTYALGEIMQRRSFKVARLMPDQRLVR